MPSADQISGTIFQVQRWSIHDGEGIRSTVFLKGCPLRCAWCANPESWSPKIELGFGEQVTVEELMRRLSRDEIFYRESGGGVTFSGGEPLAQPTFLRAMAEACCESGYHTAIETSLFADWDTVCDIFDRIDEVFIDLKHMDAERHKHFMKVDNDKILRNAKKLLERHNNVTVRVPLVAGVNDDEGNIKALAAFLKDNKPMGVEFMPCHNLGVAKYAKLGLEATPEQSAPPEDKIEHLKKLLRDSGLTVL